MGVLIRDMKIPNSCKECKLRYEVEDNIDSPMQCILSPYYRWCCIDDVPDDYREDNCPLVELPEKHGRLIDADAVPVTFASSAKRYRSEAYILQFVT